MVEGDITVSNNDGIISILDGDPNKVSTVHTHSVPIGIPEGLHPDTADTVLFGMVKVLNKLTLAQKKHGLDRGWRYPPSTTTLDERGDGRYFNTPEQCVTALISHLKKGDTTDAIAYLIYLQSLCGESKVSELITAFKEI